MVFSTNIGKQLVHMNYISTLVSATQHFHESYQVTCHGLGCLNWNSLIIKMVGYMLLFLNADLLPYDYK